MLNGALSLEFTANAGHTTLVVHMQMPPLKVVRAFPLEDGAALVHLHNVSGGVLSGDRLALDIAVSANARAQVTTTGATRLYRNRLDTPGSVQVTRIAIASGGLLELLPDPLIPFAGSSHEQQTRIDLADDAGLFWWETLAPGRTARGECFAYTRLALDVQITVNGRPIALEYAQLEPGRHPLNTPARMGAYRYVSTFYVCRAGIDGARWLALENDLGALAATLSRPGETLWGVSTLAAHGVVIRALSVSGRTLPAGLLAFWQEAKRALYDRNAIPPRKVY